MISRLRSVICQLRKYPDTVDHSFYHTRVWFVESFSSLNILGLDFSWFADKWPFWCHHGALLQLSCNSACLVGQTGQSQQAISCIQDSRPRRRWDMYSKYVLWYNHCVLILDIRCMMVAPHEAFSLCLVIEYPPAHSLHYTVRRPPELWDHSLQFVRKSGKIGRWREKN